MIWSFIGLLIALLAAAVVVVQEGLRAYEELQRMQGQ